MDECEGRGRATDSDRVSGSRAHPATISPILDPVRISSTESAELMRCTLASPPCLKCQCVDRGPDALVEDLLGGEAADALEHARPRVKSRLLVGLDRVGGQDDRRVASAARQKRDGSGRRHDALDTLRVAVDDGNLQLVGVADRRVLPRSDRDMRLTDRERRRRRAQEIVVRDARSMLDRPGLVV